ncbi:MAG: FxsA family protein [Gemmatimonadota bacterium]
MLIRLLLLFTVVPLLELWLLLRIGDLVGLGPTLGLVVLTGAVGAWLARHEGARAWRAVQEQLAAGRLPGRELLEAVLVLVAGIVLITPGVITDALGLGLLVRPVRARVAERIRRRLGASLEVRTLGGDGGPGPRSGSRPPSTGREIEL